jgi:hypothetical protein
VLFAESMDVLLAVLDAERNWDDALAREVYDLIG